jgi:K+-sensing histidine kinase KdpD
MQAGEEPTETLLVLARGQQGLAKREPVDLDLLTDNVLLDRGLELNRFAVHVHAAIRPASTEGDAHLIQQLIADLITTTLRYSVRGGQVDVTTGMCAGRPFVAVASTTSVISLEEIDRLFQWFQSPSVSSVRNGGLPAVEAIATVRGAATAAQTELRRGLDITVIFPSRTTHRSDDEDAPARELRTGISIDQLIDVKKESPTKGTECHTR